MKTKRLLVCPTCAEVGKREILGEIDQDGNLVVMRFHKGSTKVVSPIMAVKCGSCGEVVFYRKRK